MTQSNDYEPSTDYANYRYTPEECEFLNQVDRNARNYIQSRTKTLGQLCDYVGENAGNRFYDIHLCMSQGENISIIRNVCKYVAQYHDGTPIDLMINNYDRLVEPVGIKNFSAIQIQKTFRGFLGRRIARELRYKPNGPGYQRAKEEFEYLL